MEAMIPLKEALHHLDSGERFDITVVTADEKRGTGGQLRTYTHCVKLVSQKLTNKEAAKVASAGMRADATRSTKAPNHFMNSTRNIYLTDKGETKKVHIRLIVRFNGKRVL